MEGFGDAFDEIWMKDGEGYPGHLELLAPADCDWQIEILGRAVERADASATIITMLAERNWRPNLVALVAVLFLPRDGRFAPALWSALDDGSWVSPQLAVVLSIHDPAFVSNALDRARRGCPMTSVRWGPTAEGQPNPKTLLALLALLDEHAPERSLACRDDPRVAAVVDGSRESGDLIALSWRKGILAHFPSLPA